MSCVNHFPILVTGRLRLRGPMQIFRYRLRAESGLLPACRRRIIFENETLIHLVPSARPWCTTVLELCRINFSCNQP